MSFQVLLNAQNPWWSEPRLRPPAPPRHRRLFEPLRRSLLEPDLTRALVLLGPRLVGKTTLLLGLIRSFLEEGWPPGNIVYFDFKDDRLDPTHGVRDVLAASPAGHREDRPKLLVLDEVTQAPRWDLALKQAVDRARSEPAEARGRIIVTDSAASLVRHGARESLQGRIDEILMHGLSFEEALHLQGREEETPKDVLLRVPGALEGYLARGGLPEHLGEEDVDRAWNRIRQDVADRAIARDLGREGVDAERVTALFRAIVQDSGGIFEARNRARDIPQEDGRSTDQRTVRRWSELLERACLVDRLPSWHPGAMGGRVKSSRALKSKYKLYADDHGFIPSFSPYRHPMRQDDVLSRVYETAVFTHLRELRDRRGDFQLGFYREGKDHGEEDREIDFVLAFDDAVLGVEVTKSADPGRKRRRLASTAARAGLDRCMVVHGGPVAPQEDEDRSDWPLGAFLLTPDDAIQRSLDWVRRSR